MLCGVQKIHVLPFRFIMFSVSSAWFKCMSCALFNTFQFARWWSHLLWVDPICEYKGMHPYTGSNLCWKASDAAPSLYPIQWTCIRSCIYHQHRFLALFFLIKHFKDTSVTAAAENMSHLLPAIIPFSAIGFGLHAPYIWENASVQGVYAF